MHHAENNVLESIGSLNFLTMSLSNCMWKTRMFSDIKAFQDMKTNQLQASQISPDLCCINSYPPKKNMGVYVGYFSRTNFLIKIIHFLKKIDYCKIL